MNDHQKHTALSHASDTASPTPQPTPVSAHVGAGRESEPVVGGAKVEMPAQPIKESPLSPEVQNYIKVQEDQKKMQLPQQLRNMGITAGHDEQPEVPQGPTMPMSDEQIAYGLHQPINNSVRWLATLMLYLLQQSHYTITTVKGRVRRVFKP